MEQQKISPAKSALNFGTVLGLILMIISLIIYVFELYDAKWLSYLNYLVLILGIVLGIKRHRDLEKGGHITYGGALGYGTLVSLFAGIILAFVSYIYLAYVDDGLLKYTLEQQELQMYEQGLSDAQIEQTMSYSSSFATPGVVAIFGVLGNTFIGFIISLIAAAFLKKEPEHFDDTE